MQYLTKIDIITKISKAIRLYAEINRVKKYLVRKVLLDETTLEYEAFFLDEDKMYEHSPDFKISKRLLIDRRGNRKKQYYTYSNTWISTKHKIYADFRFFAYKLINRNDTFSFDDFQELNSLYRELKRLKNASTKKK